MAPVIVNMTYKYAKTWNDTMGDITDAKIARVDLQLLLLKFNLIKCLLSLLRLWPINWLHPTHKKYLPLICPMNFINIMLLTLLISIICISKLKTKTIMKEYIQTDYKIDNLTFLFRFWIRSDVVSRIDVFIFW